MHTLPSWPEFHGGAVSTLASWISFWPLGWLFHEQFDQMSWSSAVLKPKPWHDDVQRKGPGQKSATRVKPSWLLPSWPEAGIPPFYHLGHSNRAIACHLEEGSRQNLTMMTVLFLVSVVLLWKNILTKATWMSIGFIWLTAQVTVALWEGTQVWIEKQENHCLLCCSAPHT